MLAGVVALVSAVAATTPGQTTATSVPTGPAISPYQVGANVWHQPSDEVWRVTSEAGIQIVRIGGGAYDRSMPSNDQLMQWCRQIRSMDAEPMMQISRYLSAEQAADIVRHFNIDEEMNIKFWNIGNEPWLREGRTAASSE